MNFLIPHLKELKLLDCWTTELISGVTVVWCGSAGIYQTEANWRFSTFLSILQPSLHSASLPQLTLSRVSVMQAVHVTSLSHSFINIDVLVCKCYIDPFPSCCIPACCAANEWRTDSCLCSDREHSNSVTTGPASSSLTSSWSSFDHEERDLGELLVIIGSWQRRVLVLQSTERLLTEHLSNSPATNWRCSVQ